MMLATPQAFGDEGQHQRIEGNPSAFARVASWAWIVFGTRATNLPGDATNSKGKVAWSYELPFSILTATSGSMTVRAWDIDSDVTGETIRVYFTFGTTRV